MRVVWVGLVALVLSLLFNSCSGANSLPTPTLTQPLPTRVVSGVDQQAAFPPVLDGTLRFRRLSLEDGLSQSVVLTILQDRFGFLWIGTEDGLNRYNGYSFKIFRPEFNNPDSISDRWITSLYEDSQGYLWVGTRQGGLNRFDAATGKFMYYLNDPEDPDSLSSNHVTAIMENRKGELWVGTNLGLNLFDAQTGKFRHFYSDPDISGTLSSNLIKSLYEDSRGILWIGTDDGKLNRFNSSTQGFRAYSYGPLTDEVLIGKGIKTIVEDRTGSLWVASSEGLNRFDPSSGTFQRYRHAKNDPSSIINDVILSLHIDRTGTIWVGTSEGLDRFDPKTENFTHYRNNPGDPYSLSNNTILSIYEDQGGVLWIGTFGGGLNKFNKSQSKFVYYHHEPDNPNSLTANFIFTISVDEQGLVWIGTYDGGLDRFNPRLGIFTKYQHAPDNPDSLLDNEIHAVLVDKSNTLWVGTSQGVSRRNQASAGFTHYVHDPKNPASISSGTVYVIFQDRSGTLWFGTENGLDRFDASTGKAVHFQTDRTKPETISGNFVTAIYEDQEGSLWVGTFDNGLNRLNPETGTFIRYSRDRQDPESLSDNSVLAIYQDSHKRLWIGTAGGGLNLYHPETDTFTYYTEAEGLPNNVINGILEDASGWLWLSTNYGLTQFDPQNGIFRNYTVDDGLQSNEFNMGSYAKSRDGKMYFGGINGFNVVDPGEVKASAYAPPVVLTAFTTGGQSVPDQPSEEALQQVTLSWPNNNFAFEFAALSYTQPDRNQYAYFLDGFDKEWNFIGTSREGRYTNLPGGTYTLHLMGTNNDGVWNEQGQSVIITVIPPFWDTWIFRILVALAVVGLGIGAYRVRVRTIEAQNLQLEHLVGERTGALQKRTEELEALYSGDEKIIRAMTLDQVFQAIVEVAVKRLHADRSVVFVWDENQKQIVPRVSHGFASDTLAVLHFAKGEGIIGEVLETGILLMIPVLDVEALRSDVRAALVAEGVHSLVHLPIKVHDQVIGVFNVGFITPMAITDDTVRPFTALVQRAALSIENMKLFEQTKELAVIEERNRVARDLHDSAKQKAFAALAQLGAVNSILKNDPENVWTHLSEAENLVYEVIQELTFLIQEMYPMALKEKGLATTLREYVFEWENRNGVMINLVIKDPKRMRLETEQAIYRMLQEALANVARHSHANKVDVSLLFEDKTVKIIVQDNGVGFEEKRKSNGMGLRTIQERAESIGGQAYIQSELGKGTKVLITTPFTCLE